MFSFDVNSMISQLAPAAAKVAESLGTTGDRLIEVGVQGQRAEGIGYAAIAVFLLVLILGSACSIYSGHKANVRDGRDEGFGRVTIGGIAGGIALAALPFTIWNAAIHLAAPEYALMLEVRDVLSGDNR